MDTIFSYSLSLKLHLLSDGHWAAPYHCVAMLDQNHNVLTNKLVKISRKQVLKNELLTISGLGNCYKITGLLTSAGHLFWIYRQLIGRSKHIAIYRIHSGDLDFDNFGT